MTKPSMSKKLPQNTPIDLTAMDETELKALGYDQMSQGDFHSAKIEAIKRNLKAIHEELQKRRNAVQQPAVPENLK